MALISILLCTKDRAEELEQTVPDLARQIEGRNDVEVWIVDNGSSDRTPELIRQLGRVYGWIRTCRIDLRGKSRALNVAMPQTEGEILITTDDDLRFEPGWLDEMTVGIREGRFDGAVGRISIPPDRDRPWMSDVHRSLMAATTHYPKTGSGDLVGASMAFHRRVLNAVPFFDPALGPTGLGFYEDTLFSHQLKRAGFRLAYCNEAVCWHHFKFDRLERESFLKRGLAQGKSEGHVRYHWFHDDPPPGVAEAELEELGPKVEALFSKETGSDEVSDEELWMLNVYGHWTQYLAEVGQTRNYVKRGLVRRQSELCTQD